MYPLDGAHLISTISALCTLSRYLCLWVLLCCSSAIPSFLTPDFSHQIGIEEKTSLPSASQVEHWYRFFSGSFLKIVRLYVDMKLDRMVLDYVLFYNMFIILSFYHRLHGCRCFYAPYFADLLHCIFNPNSYSPRQCRGSGGSVANWPPGFGSIILNYGSDSGSLLFFYRRF
jgi:hypothetical protein